MAQTQSLDLERDSTQYATIADASASGLDITGAFTLEAWFKLESLPAASAYYTIIGKLNLAVGASDTTHQYGLWYDNDSGRRLCLFVRTSGSNKQLSVTKTLEVNRWYHIAATYNPSTRMEIFLDGLSIGSDTSSIPASLVNTSQPFQVGAANASNTFDGLIKDVRVFNDVRTQTEIVTDAGTEDVSDANIQGEWNFNNAATDSSGNGYTLTLTGSPLYSVDIPWEAPIAIESSNYVLDLEASSSQYAYEADHSDFDFTGDFTFESWVVMESYPSSGNEMTFIGKYNNDTNNRAWRCGYHNNAGTYRFRMVTSTNGSAFTEGHINYTLLLGVKYHITFVKSGTTFTAYVNGISAGTATVDNSIFASNSDLGVGCLKNNTPSQFVDGTMWQVRLFNDARTQTEIVTDARSVTVSDANLKGQWSFDNVYTDSSGGSHTLTSSGSPTFKKWANKVAGALVSWWTLDQASGTRTDSNSLNNLTDNNTVASATGKKSLAADFEASSSEYLSIANGSQTGLDLQTAAGFTVAGWLNLESLASTLGYSQIVMGKDAASTNGWQIRQNSGDSKLEWVRHDAVASLATTTALTTATWYHFVFTFDGTNLSVYLNGKLEATAAYTLHTTSSAQFEMGRAPSETARYFDGLVDESGVYSRPLTYGEVLDLYCLGAAITYVGSTAYSSTLSESKTVTDDLLATPQRTLSESKTATDDLLSSLQRTLSESKIATDTFASAFIILATLSESVSAIDSMIRSGIRVLADSVTATATFVKESVRSLLDSITATDAFVTALAFGRILTESVSANDTIRKLLNGSATIWDSLTKVVSSWTDREKT